MSEFEEKYIFSLIKNKSVIYLRYIDDIFMVWIKSESELRQFMNEINHNHQSINFDFKFSKENMESLDTLLYIDSNNRLQTTFYKNQLTGKTIYMLNQHTRSHLKKVSRIVRLSGLRAYIQPSRNTGNISKTY